MLIKITTLEEMKEKGWTLERQIMYEAKELADKYVTAAVKDLQMARSLAHTQEVKDALDVNVVHNVVVGKARKRAFEETAQKYRREVHEDLGTLPEQEAGGY